MKKIPVIVLIGALAFGFTGCTNMTRTQQGALAGSAGIELIGGGISALTGGSGTTGALIGGGLGALAGGIYGNQQERNHDDRHW
ncbi:cell envelope biogenesis protein OmpA [Mailhella massiliensis]|uniref:cell envelope biogenesis protein OmpA n=1 Tax=Mailhella massiliensis TaxID=1903261 RepID=UPI00097D3A5F|nr:cell envelope biogenesis protein OmpA [Mailhella massiliensis]